MVAGLPGLVGQSLALAMFLNAPDELLYIILMDEQGMIVSRVSFESEAFTEIWIAINDAIHVTARVLTLDPDLFSGLGAKVYVAFFRAFHQKSPQRGLKLR